MRTKISKSNTLLKTTYISFSIVCTKSRAMFYPFVESFLLALAILSIDITFKGHEKIS